MTVCSILTSEHGDVKHITNVHKVVWAIAYIIYRTIYREGNRGPIILNFIGGLISGQESILPGVRDIWRERA